MSKRFLVYLSLVGVAIAIWAVLPSFLNDYWVAVMTEMLIYGLFAMAIDIVTGYTGLPSLGHAAFFGTGAYALGISLVRLGQGQVTSLFLAMVVTIVMAAIIGPVALRSRGIFFLLLMAGFSMMLWAIAWKWLPVTGGDDGLVGITRLDLGLSWWDLSSAAGFYYFVLVVFVLAAIALYVITKSPLGQSLIGIRESESRMRSLGYNVWLHSYIGFIISGFFAGLAGILFAWYNLFLSPGQFHLVLSTEGLLMVVLGGGGVLWGAFLGGVLITLLKHTASLIAPIHWMLIVGTVYIVAIIAMPRGISGMIKRRWRL